MQKQDLLQCILTHLKADHTLLLQAAKKAHEAATHEENIPDNKYETLALEASYIAQGQANRAQEIAGAIQEFEQLALREFGEEEEIRLSALVRLEDEEGRGKLVFLAPASGGLSVDFEGESVQLITPPSPLGRALLGSVCGDLIELGGKEYEILEVW